MFTKSKQIASNSSESHGTPVRSAVTALALAAVLAASFATQASAQEKHGPDPMDAVAETLNVEPEQLRGCLGEPPAPGKQPSTSERATVTTCLQGQNSALSEDQIDAAMEAMHNAGPPKPRS